MLLKKRACHKLLLCRWLTAMLLNKYTTSFATEGVVHYTHCSLCSRRQSQHLVTQLTDTPEDTGSHPVAVTLKLDEIMHLAQWNSSSEFHTLWKEKVVKASKGLHLWCLNAVNEFEKLRLNRFKILVVVNLSWFTWKRFNRNIKPCLFYSIYITVGKGSLQHQCLTAACRCWWPPHWAPASERCRPTGASTPTESPATTGSAAPPASPRSLPGCYTWLCTTSALRDRTGSSVLTPQCGKMHVQVITPLPF